MNRPTDKSLASFGTVSDGKTSITVEVMSYNDGPPRVAMLRTMVKADGEVAPLKLGRISLAAMAALLPLLTLAAAWTADAAKPAAPAKRPSARRKAKPADPAQTSLAAAA